MSNYMVGQSVRFPFYHGVGPWNTKTKLFLKLHKTLNYNNPLEYTLALNLLVTFFFVNFSLFLTFLHTLVNF